MNIWLICQYYKPEPGAPSARLSGFAKVWAHDEHDVRVLTGFPNHPNGVLHEEYTNKPAFYTEDYEGVTLWRHWLYITANEGFGKKVLSHLSFAASLLRNLVGRDHKPDVIVASSPSFFAAISGWILARRYGAKFVMEVRDLWPGIFVDLGVLNDGPLLRFLEKIELFLYQRADAVVAVTKGFAKNIADRGIPSDKIFVITNGVSDLELEAEAIAPTDGTLERLRNDLQLSPLTRVVLYIGAHGISQGLGQVVEAAKILLARSDILFLFVGDGADKQRLKKIARGLPNVQFLPSQDKFRTWAFYHISTMALVPLRDLPGFTTFIPSKMFEIMAASKPVVACLKGEALDILQKSGGGVAVPPENPERLAYAILNLVDHPEKAQALGAAGRAFVETHYRHSTLARNYLGIFERLLDPQ